MPNKLSWLKRVDLKHIFTVSKDKVYIDEMHAQLNYCKKIVTIGAEFIGVKEILGGEVSGGLSIGEITNTIEIIIQNRMNINSLLTTQIGTHPLLTASPASSPLSKAVENASSKIMFNGKLN